MFSQLLFKPVDKSSFDKIDNAGRPAESNVRSAQYPQLLPDGRAIVRLKAPEAHKVQLDLGKKYDMVKGPDGVWEAVTDSLSEGFHYYTLIVDGVSVCDPSSETFYGMWEEFLKSDTYQQGEGSTVARCTDGSLFSQKHTAIAGVANVGLDVNWCGYTFAQANWYAFGRLAWNNKLTSEQIADEWIKLTFKQSAAENSDWQANFLSPVKKMMLDSREAAVNYMIAELKACQDANTAKNGDWGKGYVGAVPGSKAIWSTFQKGDFAAFRAA